MGSIEIMLNFPVMDMNMNVLLNEPDNATDAQKGRMTKFWGDESWREAAYDESIQSQLFGNPDEEKIEMDELAGAFQQRLKKVAGFKHVPDPILFKNRSKAPLYYIVFATQNATGAKIFRDISKDYVD
jgi:three-Cys-motif partner protein